MNTKSRLSRCWWLGLASSLAMGGAIPLGIALLTACLSGRALAQSKIVPDTTLKSPLKNESSVVIPNFNNLPVEVITGGARRGANLFHSFREFNVSAGRGAYFYSPDASIQNILARVTGGNRSEILGTLGTFGKSNPNLFLINPNGIIFGPNASLDVGGSFVATTANAIQFGNQGVFSASAPDVPSVLTVNPSAFLFNQMAAGPITNQSVSGLRVPVGQSLVLLGGDVRLDGGFLQAPGGRVELGGVAGAGTVGLNVDDNNLRLTFPNSIMRADVFLTNEAVVSASGEGGGDIQVTGRQVTLTDGSEIGAVTLGSKPGGTVAVNASESLKLIGVVVDTSGVSSTGLFAETRGDGAAGNLSIDNRQ